jgi:hypothetical protein
MRLTCIGTLFGPPFLLGPARRFRAAQGISNDVWACVRELLARRQGNASPGAGLPTLAMRGYARTRHQITPGTPFGYCAYVHHPPILAERPRTHRPYRRPGPKPGQANARRLPVVSKLSDSPVFAIWAFGRPTNVHKCRCRFKMETHDCNEQRRVNEPRGRRQGGRTIARNCRRAVGT